MVLLQVDLNNKANKTLELYKLYSGSESKALALNKLLEEFDLSTLRNEFMRWENE